jgi:hypothetical protein
VLALAVMLVELVVVAELADCMLSVELDAATAASAEKADANTVLL